MPFLMVLSTVGFMFGTGGRAIAAKTLGEGKANSRLSLFVWFAFGAGVILSVLGIIFSDRSENNRHICRDYGASCGVPRRASCSYICKLLFFGISGVWMSIIVAEFIAVAMSAVFLIVKRKRFHY